MIVIFNRPLAVSLPQWKIMQPCHVMKCFFSPVAMKFLLVLSPSPMIRGSGRGFRSSLNVFTCEAVWAKGGLRPAYHQGGLQGGQTSGAFFGQVVSIYKYDVGGAAVPSLGRNLWASHVEGCGWCHGQRSPATFCRLLILANRMSESNAPLPGRFCPLYATVFHAATKDTWTLFPTSRLDQESSRLCCQRW